VIASLTVRRPYEWMRASPSGLVALALTVGGAAGAGAVGFRYLILAFTYAFTGHRDYSAAGHAPYGFGRGIGFWFVVAAPVLGGLVYGPLVHFFAREARGHGVPEVMLAVAERGGRIRPQVAVVKALASALCIGSGGSVGREGPIVQIGSALGSTLGQLTRLPESRLRILVACGAAGGVSATFNAPIAGVFFGLELILRDFEAESFGVVVLASFVADIIGRATFGSHPFLTLPAFQLRTPLEYPLYVGLGLAAAVVGVAFIRVLYGSEDLADRLWRGPEWLRPAAGGLLLGLVLLALPQLYGVGYPPLERAIRGNDALWLLLLLVCGKLLATCLTIAIGGSGGVFAPSLFMGAMLGSAYGTAVHHALPALTAPAGTYGLVGMGAVFAAAARAPITAVIVIFELTGDYRIILPLMFAVALAAGTSRVLSHDTIYTLKLRRRGIDVIRTHGVSLMQLLHVRDAMKPAPLALAEDTPLSEAIAQLSETPEEGLAVVDALGIYRGTISLEQVERALRDNELGARSGDLAEELPALHSEQTLEQALALLVRAHSGLPVVASDGKPVGWLGQRDLLRAYNARLERTRRPATSAEARGGPPESSRPNGKPTHGAAPPPRRRGSPRSEPAGSPKADIDLPK
jgi:CIC family chloride channel protein